MKFLRSEKAASEVIGHVIILGLTITGVALIALIGVPSIFSLQDMANIRNAEQAFTVLDSRASIALLGESPMQVVDINLGGGTLAVKPNGTGRESYMIIGRENEGDTIIIPMGKMEYRLGDRIVAYEGGGVWSKYPSGGSVMLSPPEFHYNGRTLTLPAINIAGDAAIGGKGAAAVYLKKNGTKVIFPDPYQGTNRTNPINSSISGTIYVNVTSDFYDAWADYARSLLYTKVRTDENNRTASIELTVVPSGFGASTDITYPVSFRGLPDTGAPLDNFSFRIYNNNNFNNFNWDIRAKTGNRILIFYIKKNPPNRVELMVGYQDNDNIINPSDGETWGGANFYIQTDAKGSYIDVDLLDISRNLTYQNENVGSTNANLCQQPVSGTVRGIRTTADSWSNIYINTSNANKTQSIYNVTQHYIRKMAEGGDIFFFKCAPAVNNEQNQNNEPADDSSVLVDYNPVGAITFLYISDNKADVTAG
ncbi:hypothetical protein ANME2D_01824 [Candidatus Methanoperedens nitroreducens]|uniref:DUF7308 domain-containing protein n=1 Tax=Candidatus Methanoperedens nitratireducens TaxID=1392998 RepID=A0A062V7L9_9EURY|nr:hypothetical protein [Candidatus Methanoperedens nitroreducens]KCZ71769.1 hypothetical protein ANME2D_01824 [Candidatus Methanoperedens nitroreducens]MDJ1422258.1 hypothetical protein [Candidatus Methanoperedens sp.]